MTDYIDKEAMRRAMREQERLHGLRGLGWVEAAMDRLPTLTPPNDMDLGFDVIDTKTGEYPDLEKIALTEEWAQGLVYCDMDGFAVREDGSLILLDECGNCVSCPPGRFEIRLQDGGDSTEGQIATEGMKDDH